MSTPPMAPAPLVSLRANEARRWFLDQQTWIRVGTEQSGGSVAIVEHLIPAAAESPGTSTTSRTSPSTSGFGEFLPQERSRSMPTYIALVNWTEQGIKNFRDSGRRAEDYRGLVEKNGGQVRQLLWTLGPYDLVVVTDFPDDETATAVVLQTAAGGNIRTTTLKAFDAEQMSAIIQRTG